MFFTACLDFIHSLFNRRFVINSFNPDNSGQDIVNFVIDNGDGHYDGRSVEELYDFIKKHKEYGTMLTLRDPKGIVAVARWNWVNDNTVYILDCIVRPDYRSRQTIRYLIDLGFKNNPKAEYFKFMRGSKYPNRKQRLYKVRRI